MSSPKTYRRPLNVAFHGGSSAERKFRNLTAAVEAEAIAPGLPPTPAHDLHFRGGKTIADLHFMNFYVGTDVWPASDIVNVDRSLAAAMSDRGLNNVMEQYFSGSITSHFDGSEKLGGPAPGTVSQGDIEALVSSLANQGKFSGKDLSATVFNFMLPPGTVLNDDAGSTSPVAARTAEVKSKRGPIPDEDAADSLNGLGGYHGSIHINSDTIYYAVGVYSEVRADGSENGIPVFDQAWKNVVATFYHELNEARTDVNVEDAIRAGNDPSGEKFLGWTSSRGEECGDFPVFESGNNLAKVFQEVSLSAGGGTVPVQFQYSNNAHGPEGPRATPAKKAKP
jgi:hypothetical protein